MFTVLIEYEIKGEEFTESRGGFDELSEVRQFAHDAIDEVCNKIQKGVKVDGAAVSIWYTGDREIAEELEKGEN